MDHYRNFTVQDIDFLHWKTFLGMVGFYGLDEAHQSLTSLSYLFCFF